MAIKELEMTWGERLRQEGREAGIQAGAPAAKREMPRDVLHIRFGEVPEALATTIARADDAWLSRMHHRAVVASSLEELAG
ncbi:MAG: hypothetical protein ACRDIE_23795 [Chloroflexota bacterium]